MAKNVKNKYLEDLGILEDDYETNFCNNPGDKRQRKWGRQRKTYGFDERETWNLDHQFIEWLYSHLMMYKEYTVVNMEADKLTNVVVAKDKVIEEISMKDALDFMLKELSTYLTAYSETCWAEIRPELFEALHMFVDTFSAWWW